MADPRQALAALTLGAAALGTGILAYEGFSEAARRPVPGDVPTYGYGSTVKADGQPVRLGERITRPAARALAARDVRVKEGQLKSCLAGVRLYQYEYDALVSLAYNVGAAAVCRSSIVPKLRAGDYAAACQTILSFRKVQGRDCFAPANQRFCGGIKTRRESEYATCLGTPPAPPAEDA
jgi:lysozyme